jgi:hypothetical protein
MGSFAIKQKNAALFSSPRSSPFNLALVKIFVRLKPGTYNLIKGISTFFRETAYKAKAPVGGFINLTVALLYHFPL